MHQPFQENIGISATNKLSAVVAPIRRPLALRRPLRRPCDALFIQDHWREVIDWRQTKPPTHTHDAGVAAVVIGAP
ncbi:hypothetical protein D3C80_781990 [compost metagenome]